MWHCTDFIIKWRVVLQIRHARPEDLPAITGIYNHYVENTPTTFDLASFEVSQRLAWFEQFEENSRHQLLVGTLDDQVIGYACSTGFRPKAAYDQSVEVTIYLAPDAGGHGRGTQLYQSLFTALEHQDVHRCYAVITLPNDASLAIHRKFGFKQVGWLTEVGFKFDQYWDTAWLEKRLPGTA